MNGGLIRLWYDTTAWMLFPVDDPRKLMFEHRSGRAQAIAMAETVVIAPEDLRRFAMENLNLGSSPAEIRKTEMRRVNGREMLYVRAGVVTGGEPLTCIAEYYSGRSGTLQLLVFIQESDTAAIAGTIESLLNGANPQR